MGVCVCACLDIPHSVNPPALRKVLRDGGPCRDVASQHALGGFPMHRCDDVSGMGVMRLVIPHRWGANAPDISIEAIFSPARLIGVHRRARTDRGLEIVEQG
jgi:hypothetical protein